MEPFLLINGGVKELFFMLDANKTAALPKARLGLLVAQIRASKTFALYKRDDRGLLAIGGAAPLSDGVAEVWFDVLRQNKFPMLVSFVRVLRSVVEDMRRKHSLLICCVRDVNASGIKLASLVGFRPSSEYLGGHRIWIMPGDFSQ